MFNPFRKRASEWLRDDVAFLATVSPLPLRTFFASKADALLDRLVVVTGTPGSGKTTISRLLKFDTLLTLRRLASAPEHKALLEAVGAVGALKDDKIAIAGCRLPMEGTYRDIWQLPYQPERRNKLLLSLIQARAIVDWMTAFKVAGVNLAEVKVITATSSLAMANAIGGLDGERLLQRAQDVEAAIYSVTRALVPPAEDMLPVGVSEPYEPFSVIDLFQLPPTSEVGELVKPLLILDDAHDLHPKQFASLTETLRRREVGPARWVVTRYDAFEAQEVVLSASPQEAKPGVDRHREITFVKLQGASGDRASERKEFRRLAKDMSRRYLFQMDVFRRRGLTELSDLLSTRTPELAPSKIAELKLELEKTRLEFRVPSSRIIKLRVLVDEYSSELQEPLLESVKLRLTRILLFRYVDRIEQGSLFDDGDPEPNRELKVDHEVADGARTQLMHDFDLPFYFGFDDLCDASWENAQQFLKMAAELVDALETRMIRDRSIRLDPIDQTRILRRIGQNMVEEWSFPKYEEVRRLTDWMGKECLGRTMAPSAPVNAGANAVAILQAEFEETMTARGDLASIFKYGVAYNAFAVLTNRSAKGKTWAVFELGGPLVLMHGLPLRRGGFVQRTIQDFVQALGASK
jgi:hypothetical protein